MSGIIGRRLENTLAATRGQPLAARAIVDEEIEQSDRVDVDLDRELDRFADLGDRSPGLERDARATRLPCGSRSQRGRCSGSTGS